jgi:hypothetical protein
MFLELALKRCSEYAGSMKGSVLRLWLKETHNRHRGRNIAIVYPDELKPLPNFSKWLSEAVAHAAEGENRPTNDQV